LSGQQLDLLAAHRGMVLIRSFEDVVQSLFARGLVAGTTHLCQGQEAVSVGVAAAMRDGDASTYTYRGHGHVLARGMPPVTAFAEILGRATGCNRGKGGSMHITDARLGLYGSFAIVGAGLPIAVGLGMAERLRGSSSVSVSFFGDGATNIGAFHEALNLAAIWRAPVVFVCENNLYGEYTRIDRTTPVADLAVRASAYAMPAEIVDGNDVQSVHEAATRAMMRARSGEGPTFLECKTYRQRGHSRSDAAKYRPAAEVEEWLARDPIEISRRRLVAAGSDPTELDHLAAEILAEVERAAEEAVAAPWPEPAEMWSDVIA